MTYGSLTVGDVGVFIAYFHVVGFVRRYRSFFCGGSGVVVFFYVALFVAGRCPCNCVLQGFSSSCFDVILLFLMKKCYAHQKKFLPLITI
jgi:hypothetical protein